MRNLFTLIFSLIVFSSIGQSNKESVFAVVESVFLAMKTNDSILAKNAFTDDAVMVSISFKDNEFIRRSNPASRLITAFGAPKENQWSEPIWNEKIEIDGGLASVWVDYAFYIDKVFSHCGVDAFHLTLTSDGWKIFYLADTRRKDDCKIPKKISNQYK